MLSRRRHSLGALKMRDVAVLLRPGIVDDFGTKYIIKNDRWLTSCAYRSDNQVHTHRSNQSSIIRFMTCTCSALRVDTLFYINGYRFPHYP